MKQYKKKNKKKTVVQEEVWSLSTSGNSEKPKLRREQFELRHARSLW